MPYGKSRNIIIVGSDAMTAGSQSHLWSCPALPCVSPCARVLASFPASGRYSSHA